MTPTYEQYLADVEKARSQYDNFYISDFDLNYAKENPAAGYGILNAKIDNLTATTPEAKALSSAEAERWRAMGGYSGGADGSRYIPIQGMTSFSYPEMTDQYRATYDEKLQNVYDRKPFEYNPETDPLYGYYKDAYNREGQRAMQQTLAEVSSRTGGLASSYATTAAAQQANYYAQQLADKIPDLYEMAYRQYSDELSRGLQDASLAQDRYNMELGRYTGDRNFAYQLYGDDWSRRQTAMNDARDRIQAYLTAGGDLANLPRDLLTASGLTEQELQQYASSLQMLGGGGRYRTPPDDPVSEIIDFDSAQGKALVNASSGNPTLALQYLSSYWDNLGYTERFSLLQNAGYDNQTAMSLARGGGLNGEQFNAYLQSNAPEDNTVPDNANPTVNNRSGDSWVTIEGYGGRYTWQELLDMVERGDVIEEYHSRDNTVTYRKNPNK